MKTGYYWDTKKSNDPFVGRWQWRCEYTTGGADTEQEAIKDLKLCGATKISNTTNEGRAEEFGHHESA
jgi:hypothetical protein